MRLALLLVCFLLPLASEVTTANGKKIHYFSKGAGKHTIFLIHGWSCDHTFLDAQAEAFSKTHRTISLDLPGHGLSESPTPLNMDAFVSALEAVRAATNTKTAVLMGHSFGGLLAREYARKFPTHTEAIILLDGSIFQLPPGEADRARWSESIARMAHSFGPANDKGVRERAISVFLSNLYTDSTPRELEMAILKKILSTKPETAEATMLAMADLKLWRETPVDVPTLALRAGRNQPPGDEHFLKSLFPRLTYQFMPGMSHFLMMEQPAKVNEAVSSFLKASKL